MRKLAAIVTYLVTALVGGVSGFLLGTLWLHHTDERGSMVPGLIISGGLMGILAGLAAPAAEHRGFRLFFLAFSALCFGLMFAGFVGIHTA